MIFDEFLHPILEKIPFKKLNKGPIFVLLKGN